MASTEFPGLFFVLNRPTNCEAVNAPNGVSTMGLDLHEMFLQIEESLKIRFSEEQLRNFTCPRRVIDCAQQLLPTCETGESLRIKALKLLSQRIASQTAIAGEESATYMLHEATSLLKVLPGKEGRAIWKSIGQTLGIRNWPHIGRPWLPANYLSKVIYVGDAVEFLIAYGPYSLKRPEEGWNREQIAEVVFAILGGYVDRKDHYDEDSDFAMDMGLS
jgi:hypothetical protein